MAGIYRSSVPLFLFQESRQRICSFIYNAHVRHIPILHDLFFLSSFISLIMRISDVWILEEAPVGRYDACGQVYDQRKFNL